MGMDTVELVMEFENYFRVQIPNAEAEQMTTIQEAADTIARHLAITRKDAPLRDRVFSIIRTTVSNADKNEPVQLSACIAQYISPHNEMLWQTLESALGMRIPLPLTSRPEKIKVGWLIKKLVDWSAAYDWNTITTEQFILTICARNYITLLNPDAISNYYEILVAVTGITVNKSGVDYYDAMPEKFFTSDLGMD
jgi:hypothetical protein